jgi:hypothetical protein
VLLRFVSRGGVGKVELSPVIRGTVSQKKRMVKTWKVKNLDM